MLKIYTETLVDMIWFMMKLNNCAESLGNENISIFVLIDLKSEIKENVVLVMKEKHIYRMHTWNEIFLININLVFN